MRSRSDNTDSASAEAATFAVARRELDAHTSVIEVTGELDLTSAPQLKWALVDALEEGRSCLVVDLSATTFMDSTALGVLVGVNRSMNAGARLAIVCSGARLLRIFELSGVDGMFEISATLEQALEAPDHRAAQAS
jgi:anti-sigma B factor antagonist